VTLPTLDMVVSARAAGDLARATALIQRLIVMQPSAADVLQLIGVLQCEADFFEQGLAALHRASRVDGSEPQLWLNTALAYRRGGQHTAALTAAEHIVALSPDVPLMMLSASRYAASKDLHLPLQQRSGRICEWAVTVDPQSFEAAFHLAMTLKRRGSLEAASAMYCRAIALSPTIAAPMIALADTLADRSEFGQSMSVYARASVLEPANHDVLYHLSLVQLRVGSFEAGWQNYEHRWQASVGAIHLRESAALRSSRPEYREDAPAQRVLIWAEQGIGDEVMFGSLLAEFRPRCAELLVQLDPRLTGLFSRVFPDVEFFGFDETVPIERYDVQLPIGSLGRFVRPTLPSFSGKGRQYLSALPGAAKRLRSQLGVNDNEVLIGLCWRSANPENRRSRSLPLEALVSALRGPRVRFLNLQYGNAEVEIELVRRNIGLEVLSHPDVDLTRDLEGVAALIEGCDLVVSVGNAVAHLSGALGQRTWVLLPQVAGWRWLHEGSTCPWYQSVRLFRQENRGEWRGVLSALQRALHAEILC
jgi:tetratricopeptide (TPR) repeat protein